MKFVSDRPFADPDAAAPQADGAGRRLAQGGRIYVEKINGPFLFQLKGTPAKYETGLERAIANGWLWLHESGTFVKFSEAGAAVFA
jgi:hypothetical protein